MTPMRRYCLLITLLAIFSIPLTVLLISLGSTQGLLAIGIAAFAVPTGLASR